MDKLKLTKEQICAVIVTYDGASTIESTYLALNGQVDFVIIVDNNSKDNTKELVNLIRNGRSTFIHLTDNYGIAYALNKGLEKASELGYKWVLTMDQDSVIATNMISKLMNVYNHIESRANIACLAPVPSYDDENPINSDTNDLSYYEKSYAIASGSLVKIEFALKVGGFEEKLFIDSVDFDFSLKLNKYGYKTIMCNAAIMKHSLGDMERIDLFGKTILIHKHSNLRKYYMTRNHFYIIKKYFLTNPIFCMKKSIAYIIFLFEVILFEDKRGQSFKAILIGFKDFIIGKYGKLMGYNF